MTKAIRVVGDVAYVPLNNGYEAIIDAADVPLISANNWTARVVRRRDASIRAIYAFRMLRIDGKRSRLFMHRVIIKTPDGMETDHINGDGLDNRKANLRHATHAENMQNRRIHINNTSGFKGVTWHKTCNKWVAVCSLNGKNKHLGLFQTVEDAALAYQNAIEKYHGEFSRVA